MLKIINKLKNKKGFTLIELIVVLAVLAIIMAIAVPRFLGVQESVKLDADYATAASIAKAAELYYARENKLPTNINDLENEGYINNDIKFQTTTGTIKIELDSSTAGTIKVSVGALQMYPDNR